MLTAIVLLWMAIKLQAPTWAYFIISLMFVTSLLNVMLDLINKWQKKQIEKNIKHLSDEQFEKFAEWLKENDK